MRAQITNLKNKESLSEQKQRVVEVATATP